jgi:hypothetical protein
MNWLATWVGIEAYLLNEMQARPEIDGSYLLESPHGRLFAAYCERGHKKAVFIPVVPDGLLHYPSVVLDLPTTKDALCAALAASAAMADALPGRRS